MTAPIQLPLPTFPGLAGAPLSGGFVYIGVADQDPITSPVSVFWDQALTIPASQPLLTTGGFVYRNGAPARVWIADGTYSVKVLDSAKRQVFYLGECIFSASVGTLSFLQSGTGAVSRTAQDKLRDFVSVKDFGAKGDGVGNDTAAIKKAIAAAGAVTVVSGSQVAIYFPAGVYMVDDGVLTPSSLMQGARFIGDGWFTSILRFNALGASAYMLNTNGADFAQFFVFENLGFEGTTPANYRAGTIPANAGCIRQQATTQSQGFKFVNCRFGGFDRMFECEGSNVASENRFVNCKISHIQTAMLSLNNIQSVNHTFVGTDMEVMLGHIFWIKAGGGGSISVFGGSIIPSAATAKSFLRLDGSLASGGLLVEGARFELRNATMLVDGSSGVFSAIVNFSGCSIYNTNASGTKEIVNVRSGQQVNFLGCVFPSNGEKPQYRFSETSNFGHNGVVTWDNCRISSDTSDNILFTSSFGRASARNCHGGAGAISTEPLIFAMDFDLGAAGAYATGGGANANFGIKRVWLKAPTTIWPKSDGAGGSSNDLTVRLPKSALLKTVMLRKNAAGTSTGPYTLQASNSDKTTVHATSNTDQQKNAHSITQDNIFVDVGSTDNERNIRVSVTGATTGAQNNTGGFGYLEYI